MSGTTRGPDVRAAVRPAAASLTLILAMACATPGTQQIHTDLDGIQQQLWKVQKENAALAEQIASLREAMAGAGGATQASTAEMTLRFETLERDLEALRSRVQDDEQRLAAVSQDLRATRDVLQGLLQTLPMARGDEGPPAPGATVPPATAGQPVASGPVTTPPEGTQAPSRPPPGALEDLYRQGYADYSKGNYALALQELSDFVERYPDSSMADDALYLIGEVQFAQQQYPDALAAFDRVLQEYPGGDRAASAFLKKGLTLLELNRTADAVVQLQHVINTYPRSEEARVARDRLRALGLRER